jgi:hypothetical protein
MSEENVEQVAQPEAGGTMLETPAEVAQGGSGNDFLNTIPEELRDHPSLSPIKDVENLARSYVNAQKLIGADKIPMPVNPTDEDLDRIYGRLGRPETAEGYEIPVDGNIVTEEVAKDYANVAHKLRLSPQQASGILEYYQSLAGQSEEAMAANDAKIMQDTELSLKKEWGDDYGNKLAMAKEAVESFASTDMLEIRLADGTKVGNHPDFIKAFAKMADFRHNMTSEDTVADAPMARTMNRQAAKNEIDAIMNDKSHAYWDRKNVVGRQQAIQRMQELWGMVDG